MKIGYARVSTLEQNLDRQIDQLEKEGCERIYSEKYQEPKQSSRTSSDA
mgnify:CR=1 FL=1